MAWGKEEEDGEEVSPFLYDRRWLNMKRYR
jgi:hypothetical protein